MLQMPVVSWCSDQTARSHWKLGEDAHVGDGIGDEKGCDLLVAFLNQILDAVLEHSEPTHSTANQDASASLVQLLICIAAPF